VASTSRGATDGAPRGLETPPRRFARHTQCASPAVDRGAGAHGRRASPRAKLKGLRSPPADRAGATYRLVPVKAQERPLQILDRRSAAASCSQVVRIAPRVLESHRCPQVPLRPRVARDGQPVDEIEHQRGRGTGERVHSSAEVQPEILLDRVRVGLRPGLTWPPCAAGTESRVLGLEKDHLRAGLGGMKSRGKAGDAAAHDGDVGEHVPGEGGVGGAGSAVSR